MSDLYNRINSLCKANSTNITAMCKEIGVARSSLSELNAGRTSTLKAETLKKIADYFSVTIDFLITGDEQQKSPTAEAGGELSIEERADQIMYGLSDSKTGTIMLDGKPASPEAIEAFRNAVIVGVEMARNINKKKKEG